MNLERLLDTCVKALLMRNTLRYRIQMHEDWTAARAEEFAAFVRQAMENKSYKDVADAAGMGSDNTLRNWAKNKLTKGPLAASVMAWARAVGIETGDALAAAGIGGEEECPPSPSDDLTVTELLRRAELRHRLLGEDLAELRRLLDW